MNETIPQRTLSRFDIVICIVSIASLLGSAFSATFLIPSALKHDLYGGTALIIFGIIFLHSLGFVAVVGVPALILLVRGRFRMSRLPVWLLCFGIGGVGLEVLALMLIPAGSNC